MYMKVRVIQQFNDKHLKVLHRIGDELDLSVDRINEILRVGNFVEIIEETEQIKPTEQNEIVDSETNEESVEEEQPETAKTTGRRKRSK